LELVFSACSLRGVVECVLAYISRRITLQREDDVFANNKASLYSNTYYILIDGEKTLTDPNLMIKIQRHLTVGVKRVGVDYC
jgi:hypothetical protein